MSLDYYYGTEEMEQFTFFRMPKVLMKNEHFKKLSSDAKLLYTFMLDRMTLSIKKGWIDKENRVFIYYTIDNIMEDLGCGSQKCNKILAELDSKKGIGLIEKKRQGLGKPDIIYVKDISTMELQEEKKNTTDADGKTVPVLSSQELESTDLNVKTLEDIDLESLETEDKAGATGLKKDDDLSDEDIEYLRQLGINCNAMIGKTEESKIKSLENQNLRTLEIKEQELRKSNNQSLENQKSRILKTEFPEFRKSKTNNTNINNTENNYTELSNINPINQSEPERQKTDEIDRMDEYKQLIRENIEYDYWMKYASFADRQLVEELYQLICDVVCIKRKFIRIGGNDIAYEIAKTRFLKLNYSHIEYVLGKMRKNTNEIVNVRAYLLTTLYNASLTMNCYYQQQVQHDMYGGRSDSDTGDG